MSQRKKSGPSPPCFACHHRDWLLRQSENSVFHAHALSVVCRLSGCHPWRFIQLQALATYQTDVTRTSCCGLHLYYASSPRHAVSLSCMESCVNGSRIASQAAKSNSCRSFPTVSAPTVTPVFLALLTDASAWRIARTFRSPVKGCGTATHQFITTKRTLSASVARPEAPAKCSHRCMPGYLFTSGS